MNSGVVDWTRRDRKAYTRTQVVKHIEELESKAKTSFEKKLVDTIKMLLEYTDL